MKADIFIAGGQKCGTTALFQFLTKHPDIIGAKSKEVDFFSYTSMFEKGVDFYHNQFPNDPRNRLKKILQPKHYLDASPSYLHDESPHVTSKRIYQYNKKAKAIIVLRDPIERAISAYHHNIKLFKANKDWWIEWVKSRKEDFNIQKVRRRQEDEISDVKKYFINELEALDRSNYIEAPIIDHGNYYPAVNAFKENFGENLLVISNEDFRNNTMETMSTISTFLGIRTLNWAFTKGKIIYSNEYSISLDNDILDKLKCYYFESNKLLAEEFNINF